MKGRGRPPSQSLRTKRPSNVAKTAVARFLLLVLELALIVRYRRTYLSLHRKRGFFPRLAAPRRLTDKIHWRKIFDRNPMFPVLQDKRTAKRIAAELSPDTKLPRELWAGERAADIPFETLRQPFVIKGNHGSGYNILVRDPPSIDRSAIAGDCDGFLYRRFGRKTKNHIGEWAYRDITPCLFIETLLETESGNPPGEIKFTVANGRTSYVFVQPEGSIEGTSFVYFDKDFHRLPVEAAGYSNDCVIERPKHYDKMRECAERLGSLVDMLRVDFYLVGDEFWFGEFTIYPMSGRQVWSDPEWDLVWGAHWDIRAAHPFTGEISLFMRVYRWCLDQVYQSDAALAAGGASADRSVHAS